MPAVVNIAVLADAHEGPVAEPGRFRLSRADGDWSQPLTVHYAVGGTASAGVDYTALTGSAVIPAGQDAVEIAVVPLDDAVPEFPESVVLMLLDGAAYDLGDAPRATVAIRNQEAIPLIAGTNLTFVIGYTVPETTELPVLTAEVLPFGASFTIVHSEPHPPGAHTFGQFSWTPLLEQVGPHEVLFRVTVPGTDIDETSGVTILVLPNLPPLVELGGSSGVETDAQAQQFTWNAADDVGLFAVSTIVTQDGTPIFTSDQPAGSFDFNAYGPGVYGIAVSALDSTGQLTTASQTVTVLDDDLQGPTIVLGGSSGTESESQPQQFTWDVSDPSGLAALTVVVTQDTGDGPEEIYRTENLADATGSFTFDSHGAGEYALQVTATDADGDWSGDASGASATRSVAVLANRPPVLTVPGPLTVAEGQTLTFQVSATDPDGDPLTFSVSNLPIGASFDADSLRFDSATQTWSQTFRWTAVSGQAGSYQVTFGVQDDHVNEVSGSATITVTAVALAEQLQSLIDRIADLTELPRSEQASLLAKLEATLAAFGRNRLPQAQNHLGDFISRLDSLLGDPAWSEATNEELLEIREAAVGVLAQIQVPAARGEIWQVSYLSRLRVPMSIRDSFGELPPRDNPNGLNGTRDFGGGFRFFPDARSYDTRETPSNYVRVQVLLRHVPDGTLVYFRAFDVDDPSDWALGDQTGSIDPNGLNGGDNRGKIGGGRLANVPGGLLPPGANVTSGYQGRLRPVGSAVGSGFGPFDREGAVVAVPVHNGMAEVDLATSFAPGDNFRVAVSLRADALRRLNRTTDIPTTGDPRNAEATQLVQARQMAVTEQLSVWRHVHVEHDKMAPVRPLGPISGNVQAAGPARDDVVALTTTFRIPQGNDLRGGRLEYRTGERFLIVGHETTPNGATVYVDVSDGKKPLENEAATLTQGDFQTGIVRAADKLDAGFTFSVLTSLFVTEERQYTFGTLRYNGKNFLILSHNTGFNARFTVAAQEFQVLPDQAVTVFEDDYSPTDDVAGNVRSGNVTARLPLRQENRYLLLTDLNVDIGSRNSFRGGIARIGGKNYRIVSNSADGEVVIEADAAPPAGLIFLFRELGNRVPTLLTDVTNDVNLYDMMYPSPSYLLNRFADAYLEPEYTALDRFDSTDVTPMTHLPSASLASTSSVFNAFRGTRPGAAPRPDNYETDLFWSVYVSTGLQGSFAEDGDGTGPAPTAGITERVQREVQGQMMTVNGEFSVIFLETIRDAMDGSLLGRFPLTDAESRARTTVHEVGHQFDLAAGVPAAAEYHRDDTPNIMSSSVASIPANQYYFHVADVAALRLRQRSPGAAPGG